MKKLRWIVPIVAVIAIAIAGCQKSPVSVTGGGGESAQLPLGHEGPITGEIYEGPQITNVTVLPTVTLAQFPHLQAPGQNFSNGRSMAFDGTNLWTNYAPSWNPETKIYHHTTGGALGPGGIVNIGVGVGALTYDPTTGDLYGGDYTGGASAGNVYKISPPYGPANVSLQFNFPFPASDNCFGQAPGFYDGLEYDPGTNTFWISDDGGVTIYNVTPAGGIISSFPFANVGGSCNSGIALAGNFLWLVDINANQIIQATKTGSPLAVLPIPGYLAEDIAFDAVTFAPKCVIWANEATLGNPQIRAYEVPCCPYEPVEDPDVRTQGFWKRVCKKPHPSGEHENLPGYVDCVNEYATFSEVADVDDLCDRLNPDPKNNKCEQAEAQFMALLLNLCSGRVGECNCIDDPDLGETTVGEAADHIDGLLSNVGRTHEDCVLAQAIADRINSGETLVECP